MPAMGKQSQIVTVRVVFGRPNLGLCLRLKGKWDVFAYILVLWIRV